MRTSASILLVTAAVLGAGCTVPSQPAGELPPELRLGGVAFRFYRADALRAFGVAETATLRRDSEVLHAQKVEATLPDGAVPVRVSAPAVEGSLRERTFEASGGVLVTHGTDVARTERARFVPDGKDGHVEGDDPVAITGRGYRLTGAGFTLDPAAGTILVRGGAKLVAGLGEAR